MSRPVRLHTALILAYVLRGIVYLCVIPPGEMWDEYSHTAYVDLFATTGRAAVYGRDRVDPRFLSKLVQLPQPARSGIGEPYSAYWSGHRAGPTDPPPLLYEAQQPAFYYALMTPVYRLAGGAAHLSRSISVLRLVNLLFGTAALAIVLAWAHHRLPPTVAFACGAWVAFHPLSLLNVTRVANDALAVLLGTVVIVASLMLAERSARRWAILAAIALPAAILAKPINLALVPVVALAACLGAGRRPWVAGVRVACILGVTGLGLLPYLASNLRVYGLLIPMQEAIANRAAHRGLVHSFLAIPIARWPSWTYAWWIANNLWVGGWSFLRPPRRLVTLYAAILLLAGVRLIAVRGRLALPGASAVVTAAVVGSVHLALMFHAVQSAAAGSGVPATNAWYAAVAVPWLLVSLACAACTIRWAWLRAAGLMSLPIVCIATELHGTLVTMVRAYYGGSFARIGELHPAALGGWTLACSVALYLALLAWLMPALFASALTPTDNAIR